LSACLWKATTTSSAVCPLATIRYFCEYWNLEMLFISVYLFLSFKKLRSYGLQVWLYNIGLGSLVYSVEKICDGSGEDPTCSRLVYLICHKADENVYEKFAAVWLWKICRCNADLAILCRSVTGNSIADHLVYYGVDMGSDDPSSCRIVMNPSTQDASIKDSRGNIVLSRDLATPLIKLSGENDNQKNPINVDWNWLWISLTYDRHQRFAPGH